MQMLIGHGQVPTIMPEASDFYAFLRIFLSGETSPQKIVKIYLLVFAVENCYFLNNIKGENV